MQHKVTERERELLKRAQEAFRNAYAPYTGNATGAAVMSKDGSIFSGCKVEMVSFGGTVCAEQNAITSAINAGVKDLETLAIYPAFNPCGLCRQVMLEFNSNFTVICEKDGEVHRLQLSELLQFGFGPKSLITE